MIAELDIWRAANLIIRKHGADAELEAAKRAELMVNRSPCASAKAATTFKRRGARIKPR